MTKQNFRAERDLPYTVAKTGLFELIRLLDQGGNADESQLDLAWLGLERPNPEPRNRDTHVVVMLTKSQSETLRCFIDGGNVCDRKLERAYQRLQVLLVR